MFMLFGFTALHHKINHGFQTLLQLNTPYVKNKVTKHISLSLPGNFVFRKLNSAMFKNKMKFCITDVFYHALMKMNFANPKAIFLPRSFGFEMTMVCLFLSSTCSQNDKVQQMLTGRVLTC